MQNFPGPGSQILQTMLNLRTQIKEAGNSEKDYFSLFKEIETMKRRKQNLLANLVNAEILINRNLNRKKKFIAYTENKKPVQEKKAIIIYYMAGLLNHA